MPPPESSPTAMSLSPDQRRRAIYRSYTNALVWAFGNGLVSTTLIVYLALELGVTGLAISLILAAPRVAGLLRLAMPALVARFAPLGFGRKRFCLVGYLASGLVLLAVPLTPWLATQVGPERGLLLLPLVWSLYHLLEYSATVALWSWIGDLYPHRLRSRLLGYRERALVVGRIAGLLLSFLLAWAGSTWFPLQPRWVPLAVSAGMGALLLVASIVPLIRIPSLASTSSALPRRLWQTFVRALCERPYRRLFTYSCAFGIANGLTTTAQAIYPQRILQVSYPTMLAMRLGMRGGQSALAPWSGRAISRWGARRVMFPAQLLVATGPLFFWGATPSCWWIVAGAFLVWIAYAPINVGLDTLKLDLADPENNSPYVALYHAISDLANAITILLGGVVYDLLTGAERTEVLTVYTLLFLLGWVARTLVASLILRFDEQREPPVEVAQT